MQLLDLSGLTCGLSDPNLLARIAPCLQQLTELRFCSKHSVTDQHTMERVLGVLSSKLPALRVLSLHGMLVSGEMSAGSACQVRLSSIRLLDARCLQALTISKESHKRKSREHQSMRSAL